MVIAILAMGTEYSTRTIRLTLAANPRRPVVFAAKVAVVTVLVAGGGALGVLGSLAAGRAILPGNGFTAAVGYPPLSLADGPTLRAAAGTVLYLTLIGLGVTAALRDTAGSLATVLGLLFGPPMFAAFISDAGWQERILKSPPWPPASPSRQPSGSTLCRIGPWPGIGVLAAYSVAALALGAALFKIRDA